MSAKGTITRADYIDWNIAVEKVRLIKDKKPVMAALIATGICTGLRISDLKGLKVEALGPQIMIVEKKTRKPRILQLNPWALEMLGSPNLPSSGFLFSKDGMSALTTQHINRELKNIFADVKGVRISSHSLRKTFGRRVMEQHGYSAEALLLLMDAFNHSSPAMTKVYLGIRQEEVNKIYMSVI